MLRKNKAPIQDHLIDSLMKLNDSNDPELIYLIKELQKVKIVRESDVFIFITLCLESYPEIINHFKRQSLEALYDACFSEANPEELLDILNKPVNSKVKELIYHYVKDLVDKHKKKNAPPPRNLMERFIQHNLSDKRNQGDQPSKLVSYLLQDYVRFAKKLQENEEVKLRKP